MDGELHKMWKKKPCDIQIVTSNLIAFSSKLVIFYKNLSIEMYAN